LPATQASPAEQRCPQPPQFWNEIWVSTHWLLQSVFPTSHAHPPAEQIWPAGQTVPQLPQLAGSLFVSTQPPPHKVSGCVHPAAQLPALQT